MNSPNLDRVIEHLRGLAAEASTASDIELSRRLLERFCDIHPSLRDFEAEVLKICVADTPCEWLLAPNADPDRRLLYIHGGGWTSVPR